MSNLVWQSQKIVTGAGLIDLGVKFSRKNKNLKYLDIGCGTGEITLEIAKKFKIKKENVLGIEVENSFDMDEVKSPDLNIKYYKGDVLPDTKIKYDLITIFQVLHHVKNVEQMIQDVVKNYLEDNGILVIREHNVKTSNERDIIDIQHHLYGKVIQKNVYPDFDKTFYSKYFLRSKLKSLIIKSVDENEYTISSIGYNDFKSVDKIYYEAFKKRPI